MSDKPTMHPHTAEAIQTIDAAMFSGDTFENDTARAEIREYVDRWDTGIARIEGKPSASETIAAQRRTIATLRARLMNRTRVMELGRRHGIHDNLLNWSKGLWRYVTSERIAAIRNFGALPSGPACWMCSHDSTRGQMTKDDNGPIHYKCAQRLAEFDSEIGDDANRLWARWVSRREKPGALP